MADTKITALAAITVVDPAADVLPIVDISDTSMAASGTTKKITSNQILGSGGTATLASATITGAATVGTTLGVTGQSTLTGNVGVGVTPSAGGTAFYKSLELGKAGCGLFVATAGLTGSELTYLSGNAVLTYSAGPLWSYGNNGSAAALAIEDGLFVFKQVGSGTAGNPITWTDSMTLNGSGNLVFPTGKGIDFSAVTGGTGTATANVLNDYEEGTFAIGLTFGGASTGMTTSSNSGTYTKVGRQVTLNGYISLSNKGSATGAALITGLPFTVGSAANNYSAVSLYLVAITFADYPMGYGNINTSTLILQEVTNAGVRSNLTDADFANNSEIIFTLTYNV